MDNVRTGFGNLIRDVIEWLPKLIGFLLVLIIGMFIAKLITKAVSALLERTGFDRTVERGGVKKALAKSNYDASDIVAKIVYWALMLIVLTMAFGVFGTNPISDVLATIVAFIPKIIVAIIIVVIVAAIAAAARELISNSLGGLSYGKTLGNAVGGVILFLGIIAALNTINIGQSVTAPILYAILASIVGIIVVGVGGGLIKPMSQRWDGILDNLVHETSRMKEEVAKAPSLREQAEQTKEKVQSAAHDAQRKVDEADAQADRELRAEHANKEGAHAASQQGYYPGDQRQGGNTRSQGDLGQQYAQQQGQHAQDPHGDQGGWTGRSNG